MLFLKYGWNRSVSYENKASIHLSQWGECVYGAQSWKKKRDYDECVYGA